MIYILALWLGVAFAADTAGCPFCEGERAAHVHDALLRPHETFRTLNILPDFPLLETANFWVYITRGAFVPHYLLIVAKAHYERVADLPAPLLEEMEDVAGRLERYYLEALGVPYVAFEHGPRPGGFATRGAKECTKDGGGGCIDHLHVHLLPYAGEGLPGLIKSSLHRQLGDPIPLPGGRREIKEHLRDERSSYIYLRNVDGRHSLYLVRAPIRSQLMRLLVAHGLDIEDEYNWREFLGRGDFVLNGLNTLTAWTLYQTYGAKALVRRARCADLLERHASKDP